MSRRATHGFTLVELMIVMGVMGILASLLFPALGYARRIAHATKCSNNLLQFGHALSLYMDDTSGYIPRRGQGVQPLRVINRDSDWFNCLLPYLQLPPYYEMVAQGKRPGDGDDLVLICPSSRDPGGTYFLPYAMNMYLSPWIRPRPHNIDEVPRPSLLAFMADSPGPYSSTVPSGEPYGVAARHGGKANLAFLDGHVQPFSASYLGCGSGDPCRGDVQWQTGTYGTNQDPIE